MHTEGQQIIAGSQQVTRSMPWFRAVRKEFSRVPYLYLLPALVLFTLFLIYPVIQSFIYSLYQFDGLAAGRFIGIDNYTRLFSERYFTETLKNTAVFTGLNVVIQTLIALPLAVLVNSNIWFKNFFKSIFFFPSMMSVVVIGFVFQFIYNPVFGVLNILLKSAGLGFMAQNWLGDTRIAMFTVIFVTCWQGIGYTMVIYLGGLQGIPVDVTEAACIDGASPFQTFKNIVFPMLAPVFTVAIMISTISNIKEFGRIYVLTGGGPAGSTEVFVTYLYRNFNEGNYGYGSAVSVVLFAILMLLSLVQSRLLERREF